MLNLADNDRMIIEEQPNTFSCNYPFSDEYPVIWYEPHFDSEEKET